MSYEGGHAVVLGYKYSFIKLQIKLTTASRFVQQQHFHRRKLQQWHIQMLLTTDKDFSS